MKPKVMHGCMTYFYCTLTGRKPGQFSLEDVRALVVGRLSEEIWNETVQTLRAKSKIEWKVKLD